jgi:hypothetical protein
MLNIKGKSYTYCNWAICAYHFIEYDQLDTILPNEILIIKIINDAKVLRKYDFLKNAAIQYSETLVTVTKAVLLVALYVTIVNYMEI